MKRYVVITFEIDESVKEDEALALADELVAGFAPPGAGWTYEGTEIEQETS